MKNYAIKISIPESIKVEDRPGVVAAIEKFDTNFRAAIGRMTGKEDWVRTGHGENRYSWAFKSHVKLSVLPEPFIYLLASNIYERFRSGTGIAKAVCRTFKMTARAQGGKPKDMEPDWESLTNLLD